ncbi:MAG: glycyl-radical enzyme activating protein [Chloroflexi bacterium]|nr:glycyl-radical enzyme activating protein [Chloroflexota bacterium]
MSANPVRGLIFDIQGYSVQDGPGTRTSVFLSGCPLRCGWCCNPEGQLLRQRLMYKTVNCANCPGRCINACPQHSIKILSRNDNKLILDFDRELCDRCNDMTCVRSCYTSALQISGRWYTVDELMRILKRDQGYWGSRGGVTFTGGEPLLQKHFTLAVLKKCQDSYIHSGIETSAYITTADLVEILPYVNWMFIDIKHMDPARHREGTGVDNEPILQNIRAVRACNWPGRLILRSAIIPGFNDAKENAVATAGFMKEVGLAEINILPFHRLGTSKYEELGMNYQYAKQESPSAEVMNNLRTLYEHHGFRCFVGSETPF